MQRPDVSSSPKPGLEGRNYWSGNTGSTWWFYFTGAATDELWHAYLEHCRAMLDSGTNRPALVCIAHRADSPSAPQRRAIADFIRAESARLSSLAGFVLVLDSPLHVLALRAINWLVRKPFPETVCGSLSSAAEWLAERGAPIDTETLVRSLEERVPRERLGLLYRDVPPTGTE
jgi:hypothetical protein